MLNPKSIEDFMYEKTNILLYKISSFLRIVIGFVRVMDKSTYDIFYSDMEKKYGPPKAKEIRNVISLLNTDQIIKQANKIHTKDATENRGLQFLTALTLSSDYRFMEFEGKKELVPTVIFELHVKEDENFVKDKKIVFQTSIGNFNSILSELAKFNENLISELRFIKTKG